MDIHIDGIGVWGAGLGDWLQMRAVLKGDAVFAAERAVLPAPALLPAPERRRSPATARVAVQVAAEACAMAGADPARLPAVFASSHGDTEITDYLCRELAAVNVALSPTRFHNSVHNAACGYWTIAVGCRQSAIAISGGDESFGCGLLEATAQAISSLSPVLLVAYDFAAPAPLSSVCPVSQTFGVALILNPVASACSLARLRLHQHAAERQPVPALPRGLNALVQGNPAARSLPLLCFLARGETATFELPPFRWEIMPCS